MVSMIRSGRGVQRAVVCAAVVVLLWAASALAGQQAVQIIELNGDGAQLGAAHGRELAGPIKLLHETYLKPWFRNEQLHKRALLAAFIFRNQLPLEYRAEISSLAEGAGVDAGEIMLGNCFLDLMPATACSTIALAADAAPDGVARFGRNLDFPSLDIADKHSVVLVFHPKGRFAFAAVTWPGLIGVLSGMNEHGLALGNMEVHRDIKPPQAMPYTLLYRTVLEKCRSVDEAVELLKATPRQSANNLMLMDAGGNRAVVEITPESVVVRKADAKAALVSTNHQRGQDQNSGGMCRRYDTLRSDSQRQFGRIDLAAVERMLGSVAQGKATLQSMVFEPATRTIHLATGAEATKQTYQRIELKGYFEQGERVRAGR